MTDPDMSNVPLITSVAPAMSRKDEHGREIGAAYQEACIRSWLAAGFRVISVNGPDDTVQFGELMEVVRTTRTAKELHGKPVVFIADLFQAAARVTAGPVCIVNADILLRPSFDLAGTVAELRADQALMARRTDVTRVTDTQGDIYEGFDLFAAHGSVLADIPDRTFAVGLHWWDYIVPLELNARRVRVHLVREPLCYHLIHDKSWNQREWFNLGVAYARRVQELPAASPEFAGYQAQARDVSALFARQERYRSLITMAKAVHPELGMRTERSAQRHTARALRSLARDSFKVIDRTFASSLADLAVAPG